MSDSRSSETDQAGTAVLATIVLFGLLFAGVGAFAWVRVRAERARATAEMAQVEQRRYEAEAQRRCADVAQADGSAFNENSDGGKSRPDSGDASQPNVWPQFRGPNAWGVAEDTNLPIAGRPRKTWRGRATFPAGAGHRRLSGATASSLQRS